MFWLSKMTHPSLLSICQWLIGSKQPKWFVWSNQLINYWHLWWNFWHLKLAHGMSLLWPCQPTNEPDETDTWSYINVLLLKQVYRTSHPCTSSTQDQRVLFIGAKDPEGVCKMDGPSISGGCHGAWPYQYQGREVHREGRLGRKGLAKWESKIDWKIPLTKNFLFCCSKL